MRRRHFETLRPFCPVCWKASDAASPLRIAQVIREEHDHIVEGALHCSNENCLREFPIIDGIPLIVSNIRQYVSENILAIYGRQDLGEEAESMLGDCCGPGSAFDQSRQHLSSYAWDHYGDLDGKEVTGEPRPGSILAILDIGCSLAQAFQSNLSHATRNTEHEPGSQSLAVETLPPGPPVPPGPVIDVGCSVGRSTFGLAERNHDLVLGVDLNFPMLRLAAGVLRSDKVRYPRRRTGLVYERREFAARFPNHDAVDFWACDAAALPFPAETFSLAMSLNILDCVHAPRELLVSIARVLRTGGKLVLTCPYDWSAAATPLEAWLGGHSQRSPLAGSCETVLRTLLTPGAHAGSVNTLKLVAERDQLPWHVRLHERSTMNYKLHLVVAQKITS